MCHLEPSDISLSSCEYAKNDQAIRNINNILTELGAHAVDTESSLPVLAHICEVNNDILYKWECCKTSLFGVN